MTFCANDSIGAGTSVMCHGQCHWYNVMLIPIVSHELKSHVASHLNQHDPRNAMMPLMTPLA